MGQSHHASRWWLSSKSRFCRGGAERPDLRSVGPRCLALFTGAYPYSKSPPNWGSPHCSGTATLRLDGTWVLERT